MRRLTFSSLALAEACPASHILPGIEQDTPEAAAGTAIHRQIADWLDWGYPFPPSAQGQAAAQWIVDTGLIDNAVAEVAFALNWVTGKVSRLDCEDRQYPDLPGDGWIYGTADLVSESIVADWKTGHPPGSLGPPGQSLQLLASGYCVAHAPTPPVGPVGLAYVYLGSDQVVVQQDVVSDWPTVLHRIERLAQALRLAYADYSSGEAGRRGGGAQALKVRTGEHCRYCPAKLSCPASAQAVELLIPADGITAAEGERLAAAYNAAVHLRRVLPIVEERAKLLAREGLLPGWRLTQRERREIKGVVAHQQVAETYGPDIADAACPRECSQSSLRAALREVAAARQLGAEMDEMLAQIEQAGGVQRTSYEVLERE